MGQRLQFWTALSEIVRNFGLLAGGGVGLYLAWQRMAATSLQAEAQSRQAELTRRDHVAELFNRAVGQLKDERLEIRLGAIYTLRQICRDFDDLAQPVVELLATYLKEHTVTYGEGQPPADWRLIFEIVRNPRGGSQ